MAKSGKQDSTIEPYAEKMIWSVLLATSLQTRYERASSILCAIIRCGMRHGFDKLSRAGARSYRAWLCAGFCRALGRAPTGFGCALAFVARWGALLQVHSSVG